MALIQDLIAVLVWPFKLVYWLAIFLLRATIWTLKGAFNLITSLGLPALRFVGFMFLLIATIALVADATPAIDGFGPFQPALFVDHWRALAPNSVIGAEQAVSGATHPLVWSLGIAPILSLPTYLIFGALGALAALAGRRRQSLDVFIN